MFADNPDFYPTPRAVAQKEKIYSIYRITNQVNGKTYIGFTSQRNGRGRFWIHLTGISLCTGICRAVKKYGRDAFTCEVLYQSKDRDHTLLVMEPYFIQINGSFGPKGYNMTAGGEGTPSYKRTPEQIERIRVRAIGKVPSEETRRRMSESQRRRPKGELHPHFGKKRSPESIQRQIQRSTGKKRSEETRRKISEALKVAGSGHGNFGAKHPQAKRYVIALKNGATFDVIGLAQFCRDHPGYCPSGLSSMATGAKKSYKDVASIKCLGLPRSTVECEYCRAIYEHTGRIHCPIHTEALSEGAPIPALEASTDLGAALAAD